MGSDEAFGVGVRVIASSCVDNGEGICTSCSTVHTIAHYSLSTATAGAVTPSDLLRSLVSLHGEIASIGGAWCVEIRKTGEPLGH